MKVVTFGELMVRLQPFNYERFVQANSLEFTFGGGEANVAVSLANYGLDAAFVTKLPAHAIGQAAINSLRRYGVDTSMIVRGGDRVGIYFLEKGASQRGSVCIYDRAHSSIQEASASDFNWDEIFDGAEWFHFTGITPALGANVVEICRDACKAAKERGINLETAAEAYGNHVDMLPDFDLVVLAPQAASYLADLQKDCERVGNKCVACRGKQYIELSQNGDKSLAFVSEQLSK